MTPCDHGITGYCSDCGQPSTPVVSATKTPNNVIQFRPGTGELPLWEKLPDRHSIEGIRLCRLLHCDKALYAKGLCNLHYQYSRNGRLDPETGGVHYAREIKGANAKAPIEEITALPNLGELSDWVYIGSLKEFIKKENLQRISLHAAVEVGGNAIRSLIRSKKFEVHLWTHFLVYNPHDLERQLDEEGNPAKPPSHQGFYNTFLPEKMMWPKEPSTKLPPALETLIANLAGDEREYFDKWMAFMLRRPGTLGCALVLRGIHGSGKSVFSALLEEIYGHYAVKVRTSDLENNHNSWLEEKLIVFAEEMASGNTSEQIKMMNTLKQYVAGGRVTVNRKHVAQYTADVKARWMIFSNAEKPLIMEPTERRYSVIESTGVLPQDIGREVDMNRRKYAQALLDYYYMVDISDFNAWEQLQNDALRKIKAESEGYFKR